MECDESMAGGVGLWDDGQLVGSVFCVWLCFRVFRVCAVLEWLVGQADLWIVIVHGECGVDYTASRTAQCRTSVLFEL
jgi:hypothetical protein